MKELIIVCAPCGCGKTTTIEEINKNNLFTDYIAIDSDIINWWDYANTPNENNFFIDSLTKGLEASNGKKLIFFTCVNPIDVKDKIKNSPLNDKLDFNNLRIIGLYCNDIEVRKRLLKRPKDRNCGSEEFIESQIIYANWFKNNIDKFDLLIDNTNQTVGETVSIIYDFISKPKKKLLILTCSTGEGHNSASNALKIEAIKQGMDADVHFFTSLGKPKDTAFICKLYNWMINKAPKLFGFIYWLNQLIDKSFLHKWAYLISSLKARKLAKFIKDGKYDAVVAAQIYPMLALSHVKKKYIKDISFYGLMTDYAYIPYTKDTNLDKYFIAHEDLIDLYVSMGISKEKLDPTGIPVNNLFKEEISKEEARNKLKISNKKKMYLLMSGGSGSGKIIKLCDRILNSIIIDSELYVLIGRNQKLKEKLEKRFSGFNNLYIIPFTKEVYLYMKASDVLISKPGGLSSTEALVYGAKLVHLLAIKGCEEDNAKFFDSHGFSVYSKSIDEAIKNAIKIVNEDSVIKNIRKEKINNNASKKIIDIICKNNIDKIC